MGVPSFYRWLTNKYPNIVVNAGEEENHQVDTSLPNPNGIEFDNLYLDMNGIIHPCFHPDDDDSLFPPLTYEQVFENIFQYIDRLFNIVRPRKLLYMAIDGVAPRAKMNQQRVRRFRTAKDSEIAEIEEERLRRHYEMEEKEVLPKEESEVSDSNVITPGTLFMYRLSKKLQNYIRLRMANDPGWAAIKVIFSDANVPGEGEHKIMSFIRLQRASPGYNPNTRHCLYGLDADLIMLALATHEIHFSILREDVLVKVQQPIRVPALEIGFGETETSLEKYVLKQELKRSAEGESCYTDNRTKRLVKKPYQFLHVWILRDYLELDLKITNPPEKFEADFERFIDDFIFICFFAGNDFLPHMPSLEIHEGGIDLLMHVYKEEFESLGGYLVDMQRADDVKKQGYIKLKRVEKFILSVGKYEEKIFKKRSELRERNLRRILAECAEESTRDNEEDLYIDVNKHARDHAQRRTCNANVTDSAAISVVNLIGSDRTASDSSDVVRNTKELKEELKRYSKKISDVFKNGISTDKVRLGAPGFKERYYKEKFSAESPEEMESTRKRVVEKYTEGLCWVLLYYYSGVASWDWFYPFHYGPFASDLKGLAQTKVRFNKSSPFKPFDQLMGVLPPKSAHALPTPYQLLMTEENSNIIDFYPPDFEIDTDGKRFQWQGICKLDFIDEKRLLAETRQLEKELNAEEAVRNTQTDDHLFMRSSSVLGSRIMSLHKERALINRKEVIEIDTDMSAEINGSVSLKLDAQNGVDFDGVVDSSNVLCVFYKLPRLNPHIPCLLEGVIIPERTVTEADIMETQLWHEYHGSRPGYRHQNQQTATKFISSSSPSMSAAVINKGAGTGWNGRGRGKVSPDYHMKSELARMPGESSAVPKSSSARELYGNSSSRWDNSRAYSSTESWKAVGYGRGDGRGIENLRISDSSPRYNSYGRAHQGDNRLRPPYGRAQPANCNAWSATSSSGFNSNPRWGESSASSTASTSSQDDPNRRQIGCGENASSTSTWARGRGRYGSNSRFDTSSTRRDGRW